MHHQHNHVFKRMENGGKGFGWRTLSFIKVRLRRSYLQKHQDGRESNLHWHGHFITHLRKSFMENNTLKAQDAPSVGLKPLTMRWTNGEFLVMACCGCGKPFYSFTEIVRSHPSYGCICGSCDSKGRKLPSLTWGNFTQSEEWASAQLNISCRSHRRTIAPIYET